jgi:hypothetical protein
VASCCQHDNEFPVSVEDREFLEYPRDCWLLKENSAKLNE